MAEARIPVDLFNPGEVFACLGFMEAAEALLGSAEGGFDWSDPKQAWFTLSVDGEANPVKEVLEFLKAADVTALAPAGSPTNVEKWKLPTRQVRPAEGFAFPDPSSPATLPAEMRDSIGRRILIDHWGDATNRDNAKFWAGMGGYPGVALLYDAVKAARGSIANSEQDPFALTAPLTSSFRLDGQGSYLPMGIGFSLNDHGSMSMAGFPLVEILAAIGLTHARPQRGDKLNYRYGIIADSLGELLPLAFHRAALGAAALPFQSRTFRMRLDWPGKENQARCITSVNEEPSDD